MYTQSQNVKITFMHVMKNSPLELDWVTTTTISLMFLPLVTPLPISELSKHKQFIWTINLVTHNLQKYINQVH